MLSPEVWILVPPAPLQSQFFYISHAHARFLNLHKTILGHLLLICKISSTDSRSSGWRTAGICRQRCSCWRSSSSVSVQLMRIRRLGLSSLPKVVHVWIVTHLSSCRGRCKT